MIALAFVVRTLAAYFGFETKVRSPTSASSIPSTPLISTSPLPSKLQSSRAAISFNFTRSTFQRGAQARQRAALSAERKRDRRSIKRGAQARQRAALRMLVYRLTNAGTSTAPQVCLTHQRIDSCQSSFWLHSRLAYCFFIGREHGSRRLYHCLSNTQSSTAACRRRCCQRCTHSGVFAIRCRKEERGRLGIRELSADGNYFSLNSGYARWNSPLAVDR